ncbi:hypothetical protein PFICI_07440 [Pestalotiopsis fici W106-1]|uniref:BZIP domain-containing protein n=1 Tax=Pestalotiopsis fici (strain W106-1 / CGMCC3.15140) TaxID=1229662 RepID=W3X413_PESFW|nr:uncharacterized protein PFICI_07440 [Pestalotiopsis fici W106-1]ETS79911.1 hypothetical protein PFICI_07440 [Pestalotiopsis fici W106-1]
MDGDAHFYSYDPQAQDGRGYQAFDGEAGASQQIYHSGFAALSFPEAVPSQPVHMPIGLMQPPLTRSSLPARASVQSDLDIYGSAPPNHQRQRRLSPAPSLDRLKLESPELTSGPSSTPESRLSGQSITPNITPPDLAAYPIQPSKPSEAVFPPPAPLLPRRRRPRKPRPKPELSVEEETAKREKFLERNRVAAGKCREKRKTWMTDLEDTKLELEDRNTRLRTEHSALLMEFNQMRAALMAHANCGDVRINKWVENEAKRFVLGAGEQYDSMLATYGISTGPQIRNDSTSTMSEYTTAVIQDMENASRQRTIPVTHGMSPTQSASISMPRAMPDTSILFRDPATHDPGRRPMILNEPVYMVSPTTRIENNASLGNYLENVPRPYPAC